MLKINNISKAIGGKQILHDITFEVPAGTVAFLLGESGSGKSTLLRILNDLEHQDSGTIAINNQQINGANAHKMMSLVFQHFNLFAHLTVKQNITLVLEKVYGNDVAQANALAEALLKKFKLEHKADAAISSLSGGQKQRLAIARAVAVNPYVICLDEPTSALDPLLTAHVAQQIQELANEGRIVLVATHDMNLVLNKNVHGIVLLMRHGSIVEVASTDEVRSSAETLKHLAQFMQGASEDTV